MPLLILFRLLALLPLRTLHAIGRVLGRLLYALPGRYRDRLRANAAQAGYSDPAFARRAGAEAGAMILELPHVWLRDAQCIDRVVSDDLPIVVQALSEQRGVLCLTPHIGCFELSARYAAAKFKPFTVMFRPPRKQFLSPVLEIARNAAGVTAVPANLQGVREFLRALRQKQWVGMLPDQAPSQGDGVWAPFFGRPAYTVTLAGKLASMTDAIILVASCERLPKGQGWRMHCIRVAEPLPDAPEAQAALVNRYMERMIRRFPEQYLWSYNRYKVPRGVTPPGRSPADAPPPPAMTPSAS